MADEKKPQKQSQWYPTPEYDDVTSLQDWEDDGAVTAPNYTKAYDKMMEEVKKNDQKKP